ncbi:hypothetical protein N7520_005049 [Penicillium odoratum]|uniref:uncharacterized protein n=1 Tax=Penicillium odoratum TaxID=1167516 RepID=UPI002547C18F|nr:uncharacterized protein N7520_005049 [Penicillium odoratum]KAJ5765490.1 hypothetical protein N7520_005049 [Penicillium odoratum]
MHISLEPTKTPTRESSSLSPCVNIPSTDPTEIDSDVDMSTTSEESEAELPTIPYLFCLSCSIPRNINLMDSGICLYCLEEKKYCIYGGHDGYRVTFIDQHGEEQVRCNNCRGEDTSADPEAENLDQKDLEVKSFVGASSQDEGKPYAESQVTTNSRTIIPETEISIQSEGDIEPQAGFNMQFDLDSQEEIELGVDMKLQHQIEPRARTGFPTETQPQDDTKAHIGFDPRRNPKYIESLAGVCQSLLNKANAEKERISALETEHEVESDPAFEPLDVKPDSAHEININSIPSFRPESSQVGRLFWDPIFIDSD